MSEPAAEPRWIGATRKGQTTYTQELDDKMKRLWSEGFSSGQIALETGLTRNAVIGRLSRLKAPRRDNPRIPVKVPPRVQKSRPDRYAERSTFHLATELEKQEYDASPFIGLDGLPYTTLTIPTFGACRWLAGEVSADAPLCGHPTAEHCSYCSKHAARAFQPMMPHRRRDVA